MILKKIWNNKFIQDGVLSIGAKIVFFFVVQFIIYPLLLVEMGDSEYGHFITLMGYVSIFAYGCGEALNHIRVLNQKTDRERAKEYGVIIFIEASLVLLLLASYSLLWEKTSLYHSVLYGMAAFFMMIRLYSESMFRIEINYKKILISASVSAFGYLLGYFLYIGGMPWYIIFIIGEAFAVAYAGIAGGAFRTFHGLSENFSKTIKSVATLTFSYLISYTLIYSDRILVEFLLSSDKVAVYYTATTYGKLVALVIPPITSVLLSNISKGTIPLNKRIVKLVTLGSIGAILVFFVVGIPVSRLMIYILYPSLYEASLPIMDIGNLAQIVYYSCSIINMLAIRLCDMKLQVKVETAYSIGFILLGIIGALNYGLIGFAVGTLIANILRFIMLWVPVYNKVKEI